MLTQLRIQGFKSWADTGDIKLGKLTGYFGTNSSGKTSLLQFLLMLKQTVESTDRSRVLHTGDANSYVDLGTFYDIIHQHRIPGTLQFAFDWIGIDDFEHEQEEVNFHFQASVRGETTRIRVTNFLYKSQDEAFGVRLVNLKRGDYEIYQRGQFWDLEDESGEPQVKNFENAWRPTDLDRDYFHKFYGLSYGWREKEFSHVNLDRLTYHLTAQFNNLYYLGPLREHPGRLYPWAGERPADVGRRGERTMEALLAAEVEQDGQLENPETGKPHTLTQHVAYWLKRLGLIHSFNLRPIARNRKEYEVRIKQSLNATEVALTDVGFGVSQVLPVLTLCFYAPRGSTILFEQPEIHLHPAVQAGLADVLLDAIKQRGVQIILESHSEHLLHRLQRRVAEEAVAPDDIKLYFAQANDGASTLTPLDLDAYGNIRNWPKGFFGDEIGDLMQMTQAAMKRKMAERAAK